jgi:hypothetical protein
MKRRRFLELGLALPLAGAHPYRRAPSTAERRRLRTVNLDRDHLMRFWLYAAWQASNERWRHQSGPPGDVEIDEPGKCVTLKFPWDCVYGEDECPRVPDRLLLEDDLGGYIDVVARQCQWRFAYPWHGRRTELGLWVTVRRP